MATQRKSRPVRDLRLHADGRVDGQAGSAESPNGSAAHRPVQAAVKKRRHRQPSLDAEIRSAAKQIAATGMADAMKAGALIVCARKIDETQRKLDEIRAILQAAGVGAQAQVVAGHSAPHPVSAPVSAGPACVHCGRPAVRRTKPNQWNPQGSWFCQIHAPLANQGEFEDALDTHLMGPAKGVALKKKPVVVQTHPVEMRRPAEEQGAPAEAEIQPTASAGPASGTASLDDAMASLGLGN